MSEFNDGGPAFPAHENWRIDSGMSLRDYFAAKALQGILVNQKFIAPIAEVAAEKGLTQQEALASVAYGMADEMLEARRK